MTEELAKLRTTVLGLAQRHLPSTVAQIKETIEQGSDPTTTAIALSIVSETRGLMEWSYTDNRAPVVSLLKEPSKLVAIGKRRPSFVDPSAALAAAELLEPTSSELEHLPSQLRQACHVSGTDLDKQPMMLLLLCLYPDWQLGHDEKGHHSSKTFTVSLSWFASVLRQRATHSATCVLGITALGIGLLRMSSHTAVANALEAPAYDLLLSIGALHQHDETFQACSTFCTLGILTCRNITIPMSWSQMKTLGLSAVRWLEAHASSDDLQATHLSVTEISIRIVSMILSVSEESCKIQMSIGGDIEFFGRWYDTVHGLMRNHAVPIATRLIAAYCLILMERYDVVSQDLMWHSTGVQALLDEAIVFMKRAQQALRPRSAARRRSSSNLIQIFTMEELNTVSFYCDAVSKVVQVTSIPADAGKAEDSPIVSLHESSLLAADDLPVVVPQSALQISVPERRSVTLHGVEVSGMTMREAYEALGGDGDDFLKHVVAKPSGSAAPADSESRRSSVSSVASHEEYTGRRHSLCLSDQDEELDQFIPASTAGQTEYNPVLPPLNVKPRNYMVKRHCSCQVHSGDTGPHVHHHHPAESEGKPPLHHRSHQRLAGLSTSPPRSIVIQPGSSVVSSGPKSPAGNRPFSADMVRPRATTSPVGGRLRPQTAVARTPSSRERESAGFSFGAAPASAAATATTATTAASGRGLMPRAQSAAHLRSQSAKPPRPTTAKQARSSASLDPYRGAAGVVPPEQPFQPFNTAAAPKKRRPVSAVTSPTWMTQPLPAGSSPLSGGASIFTGSLSPYVSIVKRPTFLNKLQGLLAEQLQQAQQPPIQTPGFAPSPAMPAATRQRRPTSALF